jgi:hypothetical protein
MSASGFDFLITSGGSGHVRVSCLHISLEWDRR